MKMETKYSKRNKAVARATALLLNEGYALIAQLSMPSYHFATFRHIRSGRRVSIRANDESISYSTNGKIYREDKYPSSAMRKH